VATSRFIGFLESRKNLTGSACGIAGLALTFTGLAGPYWPVVVAGLYGAGALIAPPERHLERQLTLLQEESDRLATALRETEARRQESHTRYLEDRGRSQ
jgi:hypothetical protein